MTGKAKSFDCLQQRLSVEMQQRNGAPVMGTTGSTTSPSDFICNCLTLRRHSVHPFIVPVLSLVNYQLCMVAQKYIVHILQIHTHTYLMHIIIVQACMYVPILYYGAALELVT